MWGGGKGKGRGAGGRDLHDRDEARRRGQAIKRAEFKARWDVYHGETMPAEWNSLPAQPTPPPFEEWRVKQYIGFVNIADAVGTRFLIL